MQIKYANIVLILILVALVFIALKVSDISSRLSAFDQSHMAIKGINQALLDSSHRLEQSFSDLVSRVENLSDRLLKK